MAKPRTLRQEREDEPLTRTEEAALETLDAIEETLAALPSGTQTKVRFYRLGGMNQDKGGLDQEYLFMVPYVPDMDVEETVRARAGGGKIQATFLYPKGVTDPLTGKRSRTVTFLVAGAPRDPAVPVAAVGATPGAVADGQPVSPVLVSLMLELATMKGKLEGMTAARGAGGGGESVTDQLTMFERIAGVFRSMQPPTTEASGMALAREALGFINEVKAAVPEGGAGEDAGMLLARETIGLVKGVVAEHPEVVARFAGGGPRPAAVVARPVAPAVAPGPPEPAWKIEARKWVPGLVEEAKLGQDPAKVAEHALGQLEQSYPKVVFDLMADKAEGEHFVDWAWGQAVEHFPEVAPHAEWGKRFLAAVQQALVGEDDGPAPLA